MNSSSDSQFFSIAKRQACDLYVDDPIGLPISQAIDLMKRSVAGLRYSEDEIDRLFNEIRYTRRNDPFSADPLRRVVLCFCEAVACHIKSTGQRQGSIFIARGHQLAHVPKIEEDDFTFDLPSTSTQHRHTEGDSSGADTENEGGQQNVQVTVGAPLSLNELGVLDGDLFGVAVKQEEIDGMDDNMMLPVAPDHLNFSMDHGMDAGPYNDESLHLDGQMEGSGGEESNVTKSKRSCVLKRRRTKYEESSPEGQDEDLRLSSSSNKRYACTQCHKSFPTPKGLATHAYVHDSDTVLCECNQHIKPENMDKHLLRCVHNKDRVKYAVQIRNGSRVFKKKVVKKPTNFPCPKCDFMGHNKGHLNYHMDMHAGLKRHVCRVCKQAFTGLSTRNCHLNRTHGQRAYACRDCPLQFDFKDQLDSHLELMEHTELVAEVEMEEKKEDEEEEEKEEDKEEEEMEEEMKEQEEVQEEMEKEEEEEDVEEKDGENDEEREVQMADEREGSVSY